MKFNRRQETFQITGVQGRIEKALNGHGQTPEPEPADDRLLEASADSQPTTGGTGWKFGPQDTLVLNGTVQLESSDADSEPEPAIIYPSTDVKDRTGGRRWPRNLRDISLFIFNTTGQNDLAVIEPEPVAETQPAVLATQTFVVPRPPKAKRSTPKIPSLELGKKAEAFGRKFRGLGASALDAARVLDPRPQLEKAKNSSTSNLFKSLGSIVARDLNEAMLASPNIGMGLLNPYYLTKTKPTTSERLQKLSIAPGVAVEPEPDVELQPAPAAVKTQTFVVPRPPKAKRSTPKMPSFEHGKKAGTFGQKFRGLGRTAFARSMVLDPRPQLEKTKTPAMQDRYKRLGSAISALAADFRPALYPHEKQALSTGWKKASNALAADFRPALYPHEKQALLNAWDKTRKAYHLGIARVSNGLSSGFENLYKD